MAGFATCGLFPLNPNRVLRSMPIPQAKPAILKVDEVTVGSYRQDIEVPTTPTTPVSAEALTSLQNLIIQQDTHTLDETSRQNLKRHLQKFVKVIQIKSAQEILKDNRIQQLTEINNEAKVRRSTRSVVLANAKKGNGEGQVISYEELVEARARHAEKESAKGKKRRGRKRKSGTPEADEGTADTVRRDRKRKNAMQEAPEPSAKVARLSKAPASTRASAVQKSGRLVAEDELVSEPWRAPVARMY
jgi:hypothetical protein